jgi:hypothetical protein
VNFTNNPAFNGGSSSSSTITFNNPGTYTITCNVAMSRKCLEVRQLLLVLLLMLRLPFEICGPLQAQGPSGAIPSTP